MLGPRKAHLSAVSEYSVKRSSLSLSCVRGFSSHWPGCDTFDSTFFFLDFNFNFNLLGGLISLRGPI